ncbi:MAG: hypothetical protein HYY16_03865 [Planctomycetes bacterium]|nr:hypothetical protein [Planctomycetota bacterium]
MTRLLAVSALFAIAQLAIVHDCSCPPCSPHPPQPDAPCCPDEKPRQDECSCPHYLPAEATPQPASVAPEIAGVPVPVSDTPHEPRVTAPIDEQATGPPIEQSPRSYPLRR